MNRYATALGLAAVMTAGNLNAETALPIGGNAAGDTAVPETAAPQTAANDENVLMIAGVRVGNPFDPSTWWDAHPTGGHDDMVQINFADPRFWVGFIDPERHSAMHMTLTNPATMAQFMKTETYTNMLDFGTWMSWMEIDNYKPMFKAQTWAYWMQPGAYAHMFDLDGYAQMVDPAAYEEVLNAALDTMGVAFN